jgi:hypothetical protein
MEFLCPELLRPEQGERDQAVWPGREPPRKQLRLEDVATSVAPVEESVEEGSHADPQKRKKRKRRPRASKVEDTQEEGADATQADSADSAAPETPAAAPSPLQAALQHALQHGGPQSVSQHIHVSRNVQEVLRANVIHWGVGQ